MRTLPGVNEILQRDDEEKATTEVFGSLIQETTKTTHFKQGEEMRNRISMDRKKDHGTFTPVTGKGSTVPSVRYILSCLTCGITSSRPSALRVSTTDTSRRSVRTFGCRW